MSDLRALLGDKYDDVIERLAREASSDSGPGGEHWRKFRTVAEHRLSGVAAVLPDLLAEAWDLCEASWLAYMLGDSDDPPTHVNPYRTEGETHE